MRIYFQKCDTPFAQKLVRNYGILLELQTLPKTFEPLLNIIIHSLVLQVQNIKFHNVCSLRHRPTEQSKWSLKYFQAIL